MITPNSLFRHFRLIPLCQNRLENRFYRVLLSTNSNSKITKTSMGKNCNNGLNNVKKVRSISISRAKKSTKYGLNKLRDNNIRPFGICQLTKLFITTLIIAMAVRNLEVNTSNLPKIKLWITQISTFIE